MREHGGRRAVALLVYAVDAKQARQLASDDSAVRGRITEVEIRPWFTAA